MDWPTIREKFPHRWVIVEALDAYTEGALRIITELNIIQTFAQDWTEAWEQYKQLHHADKSREYYVLHTDREQLEIGVIDSFWRVAA